MIVLVVANAIFCFVLGSIVGSFLNVVVYRLPLGINLNRPASRCPICEHRIRLGDNIPIVGWFKLGGRCRDCGALISPRYPIVEAITAVLFLLLALTELHTGGANLPCRRPDYVSGLIDVINPRSDLLAIGLMHCSLLCILLVSALIDWDGHPLPKSLLAVSFLLGLVIPGIWPTLRPVAFAVPIPDHALSVAWLGGVIDGAIGALAGLVLASLAALGSPADERAAANTRWVAVTIGAFLGWQAAVSVALIASLLSLTTLVLPTRRPIPVTVFFALATSIQIPSWSRLAFVGWWPGPFTGIGPVLFALAVVTAIALIHRRRSDNGQGIETSSSLVSSTSQRLP